MKKIREILFTIVMIANCGCLLNVGTYATLPQQEYPLSSPFVKSKEELATKLDKIVKDEMGFGSNFEIYPDPDGLDHLDPNDQKSFDKFCSILFKKKTQRLNEPYFSQNTPGTYLNNLKNLNPGPVGHSEEEEEEEEEEIFVSSVELTDNPWGCTDLASYVRDHVDKETYKFDNTNNQGRRPKTYEEWLAEKEKNEREGNFTEPSLYMEEEENKSSEPNSYYVYADDNNYDDYIKNKLFNKARESIFNSKTDPYYKLEIMERCRIFHSLNNFELPSSYVEKGDQVTEKQEEYDYRQSPTFDEEGKNGW